MDHIVPISLYRTWSANALVLACQQCNQVKADRLSLSLALLLVWSTDPGFTGVQSAHGPVGRVFTGDGAVFTGPDGSAVPVPVPLRPQEVDWLMLARVAHARSAATQSTSDQAGQPRPEQRRVRVGRLDQRRHAARMNTCELPTDREVSA